MSVGPIKDFNELEENNDLAFPSVLPGLFTQEECARFIELGKQFEAHQANVGSVLRQNEDLSYRNSKIRWMGMDEQTQWIYQRIIQPYRQANQFYKMDPAGVSYFQVTEYPAGGKYDWHEDLGEGLISKRKAKRFGAAQRSGGLRWR